LLPHARNPKDFWAGVIYLGFGLAAVLIGRGYERGTALRMGPGYFPVALGLLLCLVGVAAIVRASFRPGEPLAKLAWRPLFFVLAGPLAFALVLRPLGLLVAVPVMVIISARASTRFELKHALGLAAGITLFATLVFGKALGLPLPILGSWVHAWLG
jgi:putative tricarboxylic transport membrane protein